MKGWHHPVLWRQWALIAAAAFGAAPSCMAAPLATLQTQASGVFLNASGNVLTARHAVTDCAVVYAIKGNQVVRAHLLAQSEALDLAVLDTTLTPYLAATLPSSDDWGTGQIGVFAEAYSVLQDMPERASTVFNAMTVPSDDSLSMLSPVRPGASGSPVLGKAGLMLGVIVERVAVDRSGPGRVMLSRAQSAPSGIGTRVKAVSAPRIKAFLREKNIAFSESDAPQLGPMQAQAPRAAKLSVGIICG